VALRMVGDMSASTVLEPPGITPAEARFEAISAELAELCGQQNAITGRIVELLAEVAGAEDELLGGTGVRSLEHFCTWQLGVSEGRAKSLAAIARRMDELPETTGLLREGRLSEDQVAVIARKAPEGTDSHYAGLAPRCTVSQLRRALRAAPKPTAPDPAPPSVPENEVSAFWDDDGWICRARLSKVDGAIAEAALRSHLDALVSEWKRAKEEAGDDTDPAPFPTVADAFVRLCQHSLDAEAHLRPHGHRTTVVLHVDVEARAGQLHLGPALTDAERRYLSCDARFETWFERDGRPIGAARTTREIPRRLRRALEHRAGGCCEVPGCGATAGLHAHHVWHWEDGGPTELWNLVLACPFHHRLHHRGLIRIVRRDGAVTALDRRRRPLSAGGVARPPTTAPPPAARYEHPTGERFDMRWYEPPSLS